MPRTLAKEHIDILKQPPPKRPPRLTARRIGIHTSAAGGVDKAAERAYRLGCNTFQIFSSNPRQWTPCALPAAQCEAMRQLRSKYDLKPLVIHANYLINLAGTNREFHRRSIAAFRGEVERALALGAEYLVLHPGSYRGGTREGGVERLAAAIGQAADGLDPAAGGLTILIENTAGAEFSLGGSPEQVAEVLASLRGIVPAAACIDTCHLHAAGYDVVSPEGFALTLRRLDAALGLRRIPVWHCNDAKSACGSHLDRHQHIGKGAIGREAFRRLLHDPRLTRAAFIAETPIDRPGDDRRNINALKALAPGRPRANAH
jgi:deoxyribonuclease-4